VATTAELKAKALPCPECKMRGRGGALRIGQRRFDCSLCNRFSQRVMRRVFARLREAHPEEYERTLIAVEIDLYQPEIDAFVEAHPLARSIS